MEWSYRYPAERLVPFDVGWPSRYAEISACLREVLGPGWLTEHVGSTSVPGLPAKPVIDLALRIPDGTRLAAASTSFLRAGWTEPVALGDHRATFLLVGGVRVAIGHIFAPEQWRDAHLRLFADWLRTHETDRVRYANLKSGLVSQGIWGSAYTLAKSEFVLTIVNQARVARGLQAVAGPL